LKNQKPKQKENPMANIFIAIEDAKGHVYPTLALIRNLSKSHSVICMTGRQHRAKVEEAGARFIGMPKEFDPNGARLYDFHPELKSLTGIKQIKFYINDIFMEMVPPMIELINNLRKEVEPDIYISCPCTYAPLFIAEHLNKPSIIFHMLPLAIPSRDHAPFGTGEIPGTSFIMNLKYRFLNYMASKLVFGSILKKANHIRNKLGIRKYENFLFDFYSFPTKVLVTSIPEFDYHRSDLPNSVKYIGPVLPSTVDDFVPPPWWEELNSGKIVVLVNQGTLSTDATDLILPTIEALKNEDCILIAVPVKEQIHDLPDNVHTSEFIPFANLLPHVDILITNGGFGATQMALAYGIPMILGGNTVDDKMEVSARVAFTGCGIDLKVQKTNPIEIRKAYNRIKSDSIFKENAMKLKNIIAQNDAIQKAQSIIEELV
jgi:MGT family glycosyltransferase